MEKLRIKIAVLERDIVVITDKLQLLDDATHVGKDELNAFIRKLFFTVLLSFMATLAYLGKGILDKLG